MSKQVSNIPDLPAMSECFRTIPSPVINFSYSKSNSDYSYLHHIVLHLAVHLKIIVHLFGILIYNEEEFVKLVSLNNPFFWGWGGAAFVCGYLYFVAVLSDAIF
jgi:hypothetical protein